MICEWKDSSALKKIVFIVQPNFNEIGGMRRVLVNFIRFLEDEGINVDTVCMPYHINEFKKEKDRINAEINEKCMKSDAIIGYSLNQNYLFYRYFGKCSFSDKCIAYLVDSMMLYQESVMPIKTSFKRLAKAYMRKYLYKYKEQFVLKEARKIIFSSVVDVKYIADKYPMWKDKMFYLPIGASISSNTFYTPKIISGELKIGCLTGFSEDTMEENLCPLIDRIMPYLIKKRLNVQLIVAGHGASSEIEKYLKGKNFIRYLGFVKELDDFYKQVDVIVSTVYKKSGILNRILEAWSYGKVVIGFRHNFSTLQEAKRGIHYIAADTLEDYAFEVQNLLDSKYDLHEMGTECRKLVKNFYRWDICGNKLINIIVDK